MPAFDPLCPEVVYALKTNVKVPLGNETAAQVAAIGSARLNDALVNPLAFSGETQAAVTLTADAHIITGN